MDVNSLSWQNPRQVAKALSVVEQKHDHSQLEQLMEQIYPQTGGSHIVGITGAPGAGKSSLVNSLIKQMRAHDLNVGIIAVDPSSPFSGGAILGDRVRMQDHSLDKGVYIRSMASRGSLGGVSLATREAVAVLDAAGFDLILLETVGVGQSEVDVMKIADTIAVVLTPNSGDSIQTMKAGIMEIGDIFVINKSDLPGASKIHREIEAMLDFHYHGSDFRPDLVSTSPVNNQGLEELQNKIKEHKQQLCDSGRWHELRKSRNETQVFELVRSELERQLEQRLNNSPESTSFVEQAKSLKMSPHKAARELVSEILGGDSNG